MLKILITSLAFLGLIACSKNEVVPTSGYYTKSLETNSRVPANYSKNKKLDFRSFQDTNQILIFCKLNSNHISSCYTEKLEKALTSYVQQHGPFKSKTIKIIRESNQFEIVSKNFQKLDTNIMKQAETKIENSIVKRVKFCHKNATQKIQRCLNQYVNRDTFAITNSIQRTSKKLNGQEYLYIKKRIESQFEKRLDQERIKIKRRRSTSSL